MNRWVKRGEMRHTPDSAVGHLHFNFIVSNTENCCFCLDAARHLNRYFGTGLDLARRVSRIRRNMLVMGYFRYRAVPTNGRALTAFRLQVTILWRRALKRRSQKDSMTWGRITKLVDAWLPKPRILHPWPDKRLVLSRDWLELRVA